MNTDTKEDFNLVINKLRTTHKLSITSICQILKTYRPWVSKYILPYLEKIYLPNGKYNKAKNKNAYSPDWPYILYKRKIIDSLENSWYSNDDFGTLLKNNLFSITRKTIQVSRTLLVDKEKREEYQKKYKALVDKKQSLLSSLQWDEVSKINKELSNLDKDYIKPSILESFLLCDKTNRTKTAETPVPNCKWYYTQLMAVHDLKGYGGVDETIYRKLFEKGAVRLEFHFTSKKGDKGKKIYYYYDSDDQSYQKEDALPLATVPYNIFINEIKPRINN